MGNKHTFVYVCMRRYISLCICAYAHSCMYMYVESRGQMQVFSSVTLLLRSFIEMGPH